MNLPFPLLSSRPAPQGKPRLHTRPWLCSAHVLHRPSTWRQPAMSPDDITAHQAARRRRAFAANVRQAAHHADACDQRDLERLVHAVRKGGIALETAHGLVSDLRQRQRGLGEMVKPEEKASIGEWGHAG